MAYNPSLHTVTNKALGIGQGNPTDARSYFYDEANFIYRPYNSTAEVLSYLNTGNFRKGQFSIIVSDGVLIREYWFKDGQADGDLVEKLSGADVPVTPTATQVGFGDVNNLLTGSANLIYANGAIQINNTTATLGLSLKNSTAATDSATTQPPPYLEFEGSAWKTNAIAGSQPGKWRIKTDLVPGVVRANSVLNFDAWHSLVSQYLTHFSMSSEGTFTINAPFFNAPAAKLNIYVPVGIGILTPAAPLDVTGYLDYVGERGTNGMIGYFHGNISGQTVANNLNAVYAGLYGTFLQRETSVPPAAKIYAIAGHILPNAVYTSVPIVFGGLCGKPEIYSTSGIQFPLVVGVHSVPVIRFGNLLNVPDVVGFLADFEANDETPVGRANVYSAFRANAPSINSYTTAYGLDIRGAMFKNSIDGEINLPALLNSDPAAFLTTDAAGKVVLATASGSGTAALTATYIGFGSGANLLTGAAGFRWNNGVNITTTHAASSGSETPFLITGTVNQSGTAAVALMRVNMIKTTTGSGGTNIAEWQISGVNAVSINEFGTFSINAINNSSAAALVTLDVRPVLSPTAVTLSSIYSVRVWPSLDNTASNVTALYGFFSRMDIAAGYTGTVADFSNFYVNNSVISGGAITNWYGFRCINNSTGTNNYAFHGAMGASANRWNLYMSGAGQNYIAGNLGLGVTVPTARLHIAAGSATVAPLKLTSGTVLTTPVDGVIEFDRTHYYGTSGSTRNRLNNQLSQTASVAGSNVTTTVITAADVTGLVVAVAANKRYKVEAALWVGCSNTGGIRFTLTAPAGAAILSANFVGIGGGAAASRGAPLTAFGTLTTNGSPFNAYNGAVGWVMLTGFFTTSSTAGNIQMQFASSVASETSTVFIGSTMEITEVL